MQNLQHKIDELTPGSMIVNSSNNQNYGVVVNNNVNDKIIVFRLEKDTYPVFSKINRHPYIRKTGTINEYKNEILKQALLKYISSNNLTSNEKKLLSELLEFSFPLGIPEYRPDIELPERDQEHMDLASHLNVGKKLFINTPLDSPYRFLDNSTVDIIDIKDDGIWIVKPDSNGDNSNYFLFYKNKSIPNFAGISRAVPLGEETKYLDKYIELYKQKNNDNQMPTTMIYNGEKVKVTPDNKQIIFPIKYQNLLFEPRHCKFIKKESELEQNQNDVDSMFAKSTNLTLDGEYKFTDADKNKQFGQQLIIGGGDSSIAVENLSKMANERDDMEIYSSSINTKESDNNFDLDDHRKRTHDYDSEIDGLNSSTFIQKKKSENESSKSDDSGQSSMDDLESSDFETVDDLDESDYNFIDDEDIEEKGVFQKVRRIEVPEIEKVYKESIQKGDLYKFKLEQVPKLRRNDTAILDKINKEINIISLLKHKVTREDNSIKFQPDNYNPLVEKYCNKDFQNLLLIPVVVNKKNIYIGKDGKVTADDYDSNTTNVFNNYYSKIKEINNLIEKPSINYDNLNAKINEFINPTEINDSNLGLLFKFGEGVSNNEINKLNQDTLTIRYCNNKYNCQSFQLIPNDFDCQVNLGPIGRYVGIDKDDNTIPEEGDDNIEEEKEDNVYNNVDYTLGKIKVIYGGDLVNVVGFIRPPLDYINNKKHNEAMNLEKLYSDLNETDEEGNKNEGTIFVNLNNLESENDSISTISSGKDNSKSVSKETIDESSEFNIFDNPDKFICFMMDNNLNIDEDQFRNDLNKIIPGVEEILKLYKNKITTVKDAYNILSKFNFEHTNLNNSDRNKIYNSIEDKTLGLENKFKIIQQKYQRKLRKEEEENEKKEKEESKIETDCEIINDELLEELLKYYYEFYDNLDTNFDTDISRLNWFNSRIDNGNLMVNSLILNYYLKCQNENSIEDLNTKLLILKEEFQKINDQKPQDLIDPKLAAEKRNCNKKKVEKPKIIKYPSIERLDKDNQKVITDSDGEIILPGDYALVKNETQIEIYKREGLPDGGDMWIKEDIGTLHRLINESKNICEDATPFTLDGDDVCLFDELKIECNPIEIIKIDKSLDDLQAKINDLQMYIEFIKSLPELIKDVKGKLKTYRNILTQKIDNDKRYWKDKLLQFKLEEEEIAKTIERVKDCVHFEVTDYFDKINMERATLEEKFNLARSIFDKFLNTEHDYDDSQIFSEDNKNWTKCSICDQNLLCKHHLYGVNLQSNNIEFDFDKFTLIYAVESNESYYCKICGEFLGNTNYKDIDEFGDGEDGKRVVTREVNEETPLFELQLEELDKRMDKLSKDQEKGEQYELGLNIFKLLKMLSNIKALRIEDEKDMVNFIEHFEFIKKVHFKNTILKKFAGKIDNKMILFKLINKYYYIYYIVDICTRYLIILQTSTYLYNVSNKMIKCNYMGYPVISDKNAKDGINLIISLIEQIGTLDKYSYLNDKDANIEGKIMERLQYQIDTSEYLRNKIINTVLEKVDTLNNLEEFNNYITNNWLDFRPPLKINLSWSPDKIISKSSLKDLNHNNFKAILNVTNENSIYEIHKLMKCINNIINKDDILTELTRRTNLGNACCKSDIVKDAKYFDYFIKNNSEIDGIINKINELYDIKNQLSNKLDSKIWHILFVPIINNALTQLKLTLQPEKEEIKSLFMKYIHEGIHIGELHIFNSYNQCIISGINREDKEKMSINVSQFINLYNTIKRKHQVIFDSNVSQLEKGDDDKEVIMTDIEDQNESVNIHNIITIDDYDKITINMIEEEYILLNNIIDILPTSKEYQQFNFIYNYLQMMVNNCFADYINKFNIEQVMEQIKLFRIENNLKEKKSQLEDQLKLSPELLINKQESSFINKDHSINNMVESSISSKKSRSKSKFNLNKHIALINSQINTDIENLLNKLNLTEKEKQNLDKKLNDLGEHFEHKMELEKKLQLQDKTNTYQEVENYRYKLKENGIKKSIKYLKDILNQINNGRLDNIDDKNNVRPQYRNFIPFNKNKSLFKKIKEYIDIFFKISSMIISREQYVVLNIENISSILHYLAILCYLSIYNYLYESGMQNKYGKLDYSISGSTSKSTSKSSSRPNKKLVIDDDYPQFEQDEDLEQDELLSNIQVDEEEEESEIIDKAQKSTNLSIIIEFLRIYFSKVFQDQELYDSLTDDKIKEVMAKHQQKQQERNLKIFSFLSKEGHEEDYNMILNKLSIGKLGFKDLSEYMNQVYGDDLFEINDMGDAIGNEEDAAQMGELDDNQVQNMMDNERKNNELGLLNDEMNEFGYVGDPDEGMEEQDYGAMIGDYD